MCGIVGCATAGERGRDPTAMAAALSRLARRGPDGSGTWSSEDNRIHLGHRRLSIIDLSDSAAQPMLNLERNAAVVFNGAIYNHRELRHELMALGYRFASDHSDTEVLLNGYRAWSLKGLLDRLVGMFAFALVDLASGSLYLCRDRLGIKPLFYAVWGKTCWFASQLDALLDLSRKEPRLNWDEVPNYLSFLSTTGPQTLVEDVQKLLPGQYAEFTPAGTLTVSTYWNNLPGTIGGVLPGSGRSDAPAALLQRLREAVRRRLIGDVPIGIFLSGGMDSTVLAHLAAEAGIGSLDAFTIRYDDNDFIDETAAAAATAGRLGFCHHVVGLASAAVDGLINEVVASLDEPNGDWVCLPLFLLAKSAREAGSKVVLSGEGADELFLGYPGYFSALKFEQRYGTKLRQMPPWLLNGIESIIWDYMPDCPLRREYGSLLGRIAHYGSAFLSGARGCSEFDIWRLFGRGRDGRRAAQQVRHRIGELLLRTAAVGREDSLSVLSRLEFSNRLPELLLMRIDRMTMAHGIEARVPFLDQDVVDHVASLNAASRLGGSMPKKLLRDAFEGSGLMRLQKVEKVGFGAPVSNWLRGPFGDRITDELMESVFFRDGRLAKGVLSEMFMEHRSGRADRAQEIWSLYTLHRWWTGIMGGGATV